jgi:hypothetical protein
MKGWIETREKSWIGTGKRGYLRVFMQLHKIIMVMGNRLGDEFSVQSHESSADDLIGPMDRNGNVAPFLLSGDIRVPRCVKWKTVRDLFASYRKKEFPVRRTKNVALYKKSWAGIGWLGFVLTWMRGTEYLLS